MSSDQYISENTIRNVLIDAITTSVQMIATALDSELTRDLRVFYPLVLASLLL